MRPIFKNMMGTFREGMHFVVFPLKDGEGNIFADAHKSSEMYLDVFDLMGTPTNSYTWRLPLTRSRRRSTVRWEKKEWRPAGNTVRGMAISWKVRQWRVLQHSAKQ